MSYTIFGVPQEFVGEMAVRQNNAITSWSILEPKPEIILFGQDEGVPEYAAEKGYRHLPVVVNEHGTPMLDDMFDSAQKNATYDTVCYINSDIIVSRNFGEALLAVAKKFERYLMVGRRWDADIRRALTFEEGWDARLLKEVQANKAYLRNGGAIDFFGFNRGLYAGKIPNMAVGRSAWDNWLLSVADWWGVDMVEISGEVHVFHQNFPDRRIGKAYDPNSPTGKERERNKQIYYKTKGPGSGTCKQARWVYRGGKVVPR